MERKANYNGSRQHGNAKGGYQGGSQGVSKQGYGGGHF